MKMKLNSSPTGLSEAKSTAEEVINEASLKIDQLKTEIGNSPKPVQAAAELAIRTAVETHETAMGQVRQTIKAAHSTAKDVVVNAHQNAKDVVVNAHQNAKDTVVNAHRTAGETIDAAHRF